MGGRFASEASEKKIFPAPPEGAGKVISWLFGCDEQWEVFHAVYSQFNKIIC